MAIGSPQWMYKSGEAFTVDQSLKFEDSKSPYLQRTFTSGNRQAMTLSFWFKRATLGSTQLIFCATIPSGGSNNDNNFFALRFESDDKLAVVGYDTAWLRTNQKFRDPSAWYHCLLEVNSTSGSGYNRVKMAINGTYLPSGDITTSYPSENHNHSFNVSGNYCNISSRSGWLGDGYFDGYLAEMHYIDGSTAYDQSHFGETGSYGEWKPIEVKAITDYGTNGFYLPFKADYEVEAFNTVTWKGNSANDNYIGGIGFKPSLTWLKPRSLDDHHLLYDRVRGYSSQYKTNSTNGEDVTSKVLPTSDGILLTTTDQNQNSSSHTYVAWNWNMGADTPTGFSIVTSKGNATAKSIGDVGFSPDLVWNKTLSANQNHFLYDRIRGAGKELRTNQSSAEGTNDGVTAFEPDGFRRGSSNDCNENNITYVDWCWDMGGTTATNTDGGITSTVMANTTYGQSIISYSGNGTNNSTIGHGLSSAPEMVITKRRNNGTDYWSVYHASAGQGYLSLNDSGAYNSGSDRWGTNAPTSSVMNLGYAGSTNASGGTYISYAFHSVSGYSKISSYSGSGSSGNTITTGFRPAFLLVKQTNASGENWYIFDSTREPLGELDTAIKVDESVAESTSSAKKVEFTSTGFKLNSTNNALNGSGHSYIYMAFAGGMDSISDYNTTGDIDARVKANTTYGQSIVSYKGNGTNGQTVGHGLSSTPELIILKRRDSTFAWGVGHTSIGWSKYLELQSASSEQTGGGVFNSTAPTSSVFTVADNYNVSGENHMAYCWHSVTSYSSIGSFTGNGDSRSTPITINCGFKPAFIIMKVADASSNRDWYIWDDTRSNPIAKHLRPNITNAEAGEAGKIAFTSTGVNITTNDDELNANGKKTIYMVFADKREYAYWLDQSGKNNDFTSHHLTESDISVDNPSNNFATLNPLDKGGTLNLKEGNLHYQSTLGMVRGTMAGNANDKFYLEYYQESNITGSNPAMIGIGAIEDQPHHESNHIASVMCHLDGNSQKRVRIFLNNSQVQSTDFDGLVGYDDGDILQFAYDGTTGKVWVGRNGTWLQGNPATGTSPIYTFSDTSKPMTAFVDHAGVAHSGMVNFGQDSSFGGRKTAQGYSDDNGKSDFYYEPPSGFLALSSANLKDAGVKPAEHFNTLIWSGDGGSNRGLTGVGFQPDYVFIKTRNQANDPNCFDSVRGATKVLRPSTDSLEFTDNTSLKSFDSDGITVGDAGDYNASGNTYVGWMWKGNGSGSSNTDGSVTTTVSANVDAGFSIIKYTGSGSGTITIGHGLSKAPEFWVTKPRTNVSDNQWFCCHKDFASDYYTDFNHWDNNSPKQDSASRWGDTAPTSSVITVGSASTNNSGDYICYAWHSVDGYSKIGYWTGNINTNGSFVYTGFRPKLVICKDLNNSNGWQMFDSVRSPNNPMNERLLIDLNNAEQTNVTAYDFVANGFKLRTNDSSFNGDANVYIYMAWAEVPLKYSNAR